MNRATGRFPALTSERQALLRSLLGDDQATVSPMVESAASEGDGVPLSYGQERLWFLDRLQPGVAVYNLGTTVPINGEAKVAVLERSLNEVVRRHAVLRTTFATVEGRPVQVIAESAPVALSVVDLREMPAATRGAEAQRLAVREAQRPFDLARGPLLRASLLCIEGGAFLLLTMHHIVSDGWSLGVLIRELTALYNAYSAGDPSPLPELSLQYADYARWQRQWLQGAVLERELTYWRRQLSGAPALLDLPTDRPRPAMQTFAGACQQFVVSSTLGEGIRGLSRSCGVTPYMTLLAAFQSLLHRYSGQSDVVLGTPIANRTRVEHEGLIGFFANTLVIRTDLGGNPRFVDLLDRVREVTLGAYAHQDLPFEKLVEELQPSRHLSHHPLFQVMFAYQNVSLLSGEAAPAVSSGPIAGTAKFDLLLSLEERGGELQGAFEYNTDLFDHDRIARMVGHFQTLLSSIVASPEQRLCELGLLTEVEQRQLLVLWPATAVEFAGERVLHALFEAQAAHRAEAMAVAWGEEGYRYDELNRRANRLAHYLRALGVEPEVRVGLCLERSLEMVVGLLGILKAGGAYVPLDPAYPAERLSLMLTDAGISVLVTEERLTAALPPCDVRLVCLDAEAETIARQSETNPASGVLPDNLAYVIYTSGSTETPRGVMGAHRAVCNMADAARCDLDVHSDSRVLQFASPSSDASLFEIVLALTTGATLCLGTTGAALEDCLRDEKITVAALSPELLRSLPAEDFPTVRTIVSLGKVFPADIVAGCARNRRLFSCYGPIETTSYATSAECDDDTHKPTIGRAVANVHLYVLDRALYPVPVGVTGELYIGGVSLARGYSARPDLTAEKFIPNPFATTLGARLCRTGDLARYMPSGDIEVIGRPDLQVIAGGVRVEPDEIEAVLRRCPFVQDAIVVLREDDQETPLVAYVVAHQQQTINIAELHSVLAVKLPNHLTPPAIVVLEALPRSPDGEVDRAALPPPDTRGTDLVEDYRAPRSPLEAELAAIWMDILNLERVGIDDNFFELGGHSLLATRLVSRLRDVFQVDLPLRRLFEGPTIREFALAIVEQQIEQRDDAEIARLLMDMERLSPNEARSILAAAAIEVGGDGDRP
jgi:surfactin family lipopeptide synthetase A